MTPRKTSPIFLTTKSVTAAEFSGESALESLTWLVAHFRNPAHLRNTAFPNSAGSRERRAWMPAFELPASTHAAGHLKVVKVLAKRA